MIKPLKLLIDMLPAMENKKQGQRKFFGPSGSLPMVQQVLEPRWTEYEVTQFESVESIGLITRFSVSVDDQARLARMEDLRR